MRITMDNQEEEDKKPKKKLWKDSDKWLHDRFNLDQQAPKSRDEIITMYGYDIRRADKPPDGPLESNRPRGRRSQQKPRLSDFVEDRTARYVEEQNAYNSYSGMKERNYHDSEDGDYGNIRGRRGGGRRGRGGRGRYNNSQEFQDRREYVNNQNREFYRKDDQGYRGSAEREFERKDNRRFQDQDAGDFRNNRKNFESQNSRNDSEKFRNDRRGFQDNRPSRQGQNYERDHDSQQYSENRPQYNERNRTQFNDGFQNDRRDGNNYEENSSRYNQNRRGGFNNRDGQGRQNYNRDRQQFNDSRPQYNDRDRMQYNDPRPQFNEGRRSYENDRRRIDEGRRSYEREFESTRYRNEDNRDQRNRDFTEERASRGRGGFGSEERGGFRGRGRGGRDRGRDRNDRGKRREERNYPPRLQRAKQFNNQNAEYSEDWNEEATVDSMTSENRPPFPLPPSVEEKKVAPVAEIVKQEDLNIVVQNQGERKSYSKDRRARYVGKTRVQDRPSNVEEYELAKMAEKDVEMQDSVETQKNVEVAGAIPSPRVFVPPQPPQSGSVSMATQVPVMAPRYNTAGVIFSPPNAPPPTFQVQPVVPITGFPPPSQVPAAAVSLPSPIQSGANTQQVPPSRPVLADEDNKYAWAPLPSRQQLWNSLEKEEFDVLVVGGGATGCGVAFDAVSRGLKTALVEKFDYGAGTSSRSTKLIHGGVRYLEKAVFNLDIEQYRMVKEALSERANLIQIAPHLAYPFPIMLPIYKLWQVPYFWAGIKSYDLVAGKQLLHRSFYLSKKKALEKFPMLKKDALVGALVYYDGQHDDARMNIAIAMSAIRMGGSLLNYTEVVEIHKSKDSTGKDVVSGAKIRDRITGKEVDVKAKCVVNAAGPYTDRIRLMDNPENKKICQPSSGVHIVLPDYYSPERMGLLDPSTSDGRVIFFLPWQKHTLAGTTDTPCEISDYPSPTEKEIQFILNEVKNYLNPDVEVRRGDVLSAWCGIRPLVSDPNKENTQSIARNHIIEVSHDNLITIAGGKWTTYRHMAEETVDKAVQICGLKPKSACRTKGLLLDGAHGWTPTLFIRLVQDFGLENEVAQHLAATYGDKSFKVAKMAAMTGKRWPVVGKRLHEEFPYLEAEVHVYKYEW
ncbi:hypothetical protein FSP39_019284 [Pinctada imbricata]|uniref:Glycerol-3-phosphate dehydrogenase n=1 Tax=Pinctada imbricata TaxID=66713 RepID=A0AA88XIA7_PINIB|nr:hypothetical protein FSP39_019284 [Pinctada imbricata]